MTMRHVAGRVPPGPVEPVSMAEIRSDPLGFMQRLIVEYGDVTRHVVDDWEVVTFNRPELVRDVLRSRDYVKRGTPDEAMLTPLLGEGLLTSDGEVWRRQRRIAQPAFERQRIEKLGDVIVAETLAQIDRWLATASTAPIRLDHDLSALTLAIVSRAIVGSEIVDPGGRFGEMVDIANRFMAHYDLRFGDFNSELFQFMKAVAYLDELVAVLVENRRASGSAGDDLLGRWLTSGFNEREIRDQVITMLMAGHETTAKALTWSIYLLDLHPEIGQRVLAELHATVDSPGSLVEARSRLTLVSGVIHEALRLYPPVWLISRLALKDGTIGGYAVPSGSLVCMSPYLIHRHRAFWDDAERFDPDRFEAERPSDRLEFAYMPFGGGPRRCIGERFALFEAQLVLATIFLCVTVRLIPEHPVEPEALVTLRPRHGLLGQVQPLV